MPCPRFVTRSFAAVIVLVTVTTATYADPPARVARVSFLSGAVSFRSASADEWSTASVNYPVTIGDHLWTDRTGRLELQVGSTVARLATSTSVSVLNLDDRVAQFRVTQGSLAVRVRTLGEADVVEIDTPNGAVSLWRPGFYRVDVNEAGDASTITVRGGEAEVTAGGSAFSVYAEQSAVVTGPDTPTHGMRPPSPPDEWEDWCLSRDRRGDALVSTRYVSREIIGYEDLDEFGTWRVVGAYGPVWVPHVRAGWVPYRFGHWAWVDPWAWTWVDDAPWGFAPFHYGRWAWLTDGWAWVPGTLVARPVYAPALVAFVGGSNWHLSLSIGSAPVAWFPLGPREVYVPPYRVTPVYLRTVNVTTVNVTNVNVTNVNYVNRSVPGAVTAVPRETFAQARPVATAAVSVPVAVAARAPVAIPDTPVAPRPERVVVAAAARVPMPPPAAINRPVVVKTAPAASISQPMIRTTAAAHQADPAGRIVPTPPATPSSPIRTAAPAATAIQSRPTMPLARPSKTANPDRQAADLTTRHAQERVDIETRHAAERADLEAQHRTSERQAQTDRAREELQQQHARDARALTERQIRDHEEVITRQQNERRQPPRRKLGT